MVTLKYSSPILTGNRLSLTTRCRVEPPPSHPSLSQTIAPSLLLVAGQPFNSTTTYYAWPNPPAAWGVGRWATESCPLSRQICQLPLLGGSPDASLILGHPMFPSYARTQTYACRHTPIPTCVYVRLYEYTHPF